MACRRAEGRPGGHSRELGIEVPRPDPFEWIRRWSEGLERIEDFDVGIPAAVGIANGYSRWAGRARSEDGKVHISEG